MAVHLRPLLRSLLVGSALLAGLVVAAPAVAAPPVISGADGDRWSTAPTYTVTAGTPVVARARFQWRTSTGEDGDSDTAPFTITLEDPLVEGPVTLTVTQRPRGLGIAESSQRRFVIDLTPPVAVALTVPASAPAGTEVPVSWTGGEAGARYTLRVRTPVGAPVQGPVETTATSARVVPLEPGSYVVSLVQTDAAGNAGPEATAPSRSRRPTCRPSRRRWCPCRRRRRRPRPRRVCRRRIPAVSRRGARPGCRPAGRC